MVTELKYLVWLVGWFGWLVKKVKEKSCCFDRLIDCLVDRFDRLSCKIVPLLSLVFVLVLVLVLSQGRQVRVGKLG